jgi:hypothetical protein
LDILPVSGETGSKSAMNLQEIQHTDFADLLVVDHDKKYKDDD